MEIIDNPKKKSGRNMFEINSSYNENEEIVSKIFKDVKTMVMKRYKIYFKYDNV